ncbi:MAG: hypothetical protein ACOCR6_03945 [archaeon]
MVPETVDNQFPAGSGWLVGYVLAAVVGLVARYVSRQVVTGVILLLGTGAPLGVALERSLDTPSLPPQQREYAALLALSGVVVGTILLVVVVLR